MDKQSPKWRIVEVPDGKDVGVFVDIALFFQEVEVRRYRREKPRSTLAPSRLYGCGERGRGRSGHGQK